LSLRVGEDPQSKESSEAQGVLNTDVNARPARYPRQSDLDTISFHDVPYEPRQRFLMLALLIIVFPHLLLDP